MKTTFLPKMPIDPHTKTLHSLTHILFKIIWNHQCIQKYICTAIVIQQLSQLVEFLYVKAFSRCNYKLFVVKQYSVFNVVLIGHWDYTFSCRTYSWISKIHSPALLRTKPKKWGVQPVIPTGLKSFQNIRIPKQTSSCSVCFYIFTSWSVTMFRLTNWRECIKWSSSGNAT